MRYYSLLGEKIPFAYLVTAFLLELPDGISTIVHDLRDQLATERNGACLIQLSH